MFLTQGLPTDLLVRPCAPLPRPGALLQGEGADPSDTADSLHRAFCKVDVEKLLNAPHSPAPHMKHLLPDDQYFNAQWSNGWHVLSPGACQPRGKIPYGKSIECISMQDPL